MKSRLIYLKSPCHLKNLGKLFQIHHIFVPVFFTFQLKGIRIFFQEEEGLILGDANHLSQ